MEVSPGYITVTYPNASATYPFGAQPPAGGGGDIRRRGLAWVSRHTQLLTGGQTQINQSSGIRAARGRGRACSSSEVQAYNEPDLERRGSSWPCAVVTRSLLLADNCIFTARRVDEGTLK